MVLPKNFKDRKKKITTSSQIQVEDFYLPKEKDDYVNQLGDPGSFPFTRGIQPTMYRGKLWTMRLYSGFATAKESNQRYKKLIANGGTGLSVAFDLPTQMGLDSDDPRAQGEVGKAGVAIDSLEDMRTLFEGIDLTKVSTSMTINATAMILLALYIAVAEEKKIPLDQISGTIQNDILKEYAARGTYIYPPEPSMRLITDIFSYCKDHVPKWNTISISGYHIREAGSTAVQEVAFTLANGLSYVKAALKSGLQIDEFAPRLSFFFNAHNHFFEEVAKFRAARRLWARLMKNFGASEASCRLRFHTQTGGSTLTAQQIDNNVVRVAYQAMAAVLGGTQSLHTNSRDEALALPTEAAAKLALRTQQVLAHETGVADVVDPLAGSYFIESLTDEIEKRAKDYIAKIEDMGGSVKAIENGFIQNEIQNAAFAYQKAIENGGIQIVGVNSFTEDEIKIKNDVLKIDPKIEQEQVAQLKALKKSRDDKKIKNVLENLKKSAASRENLVPSVLAAVKAYATVGEISSALQEVFGHYQEQLTL